MTDAATTLAQKIKRKHRAIRPLGAIGFQMQVCSCCKLLWPCDAVRAADMLLELARDGERLDWLEASAEEFANPRIYRTRNGWNTVETQEMAGTFREVIDAARNVKQDARCAEFAERDLHARLAEAELVVKTARGYIDHLYDYRDLCVAVSAYDAARNATQEKP